MFINVLLDKCESDILSCSTKIYRTFGEVNQTMSDVRRLAPSLLLVRHFESLAGSVKASLTNADTLAMFATGQGKVRKNKKIQGQGIVRGN